MRRVALLILLLAGLLPSASGAATRVLLLDDIGAADARFAWDRIGSGQVGLSATVNRRICWNLECTDLHSTGALDGFVRESRDVFYVGDGERQPVPCGRTQGFFAGPRFFDTCRIRVEPERVCEAWYSAGDCVASTIRYRVYLEVDDRELADRGAAPRGGPAGD